jgi:hypothetical protein
MPDEINTGTSEQISEQGQLSLSRINQTNGIKLGSTQFFTGSVCTWFLADLPYSIQHDNRSTTCMQVAASTFEKDLRTRISPSQMSLALLALLLIVVS